MLPNGVLSFKALMHCGVYALVRKGEIVYVGKTKKLWIRLYAHCNGRAKLPPMPVGYTTQKKGIQFDDIWVWPCMWGQLDSLEVCLIQKYDPKYNVKDKLRPIMPIPNEIRQLLSQVVVISPELPPSRDSFQKTGFIPRRL